MMNAYSSVYHLLYEVKIWEEPGLSLAVKTIAAKKRLTTLFRNNVLLPRIKMTALVVTLQYPKDHLVISLKKCLSGSPQGENTQS